MSRNIASTDTTYIITGNDHALGWFLQVQDDRYIASVDDKQGEGYVLDYDTMFGLSLNLIGATVDDLFIVVSPDSKRVNRKRIKELVDIFIKSKGL